jgi:outer membrane protein assembly factor BamA
VPWLIWTNKIAWMNPRIDAGTDTLYPSTETIFTEATAPGLDRQPNFLETSSLVEFEGRDQPGNPRAGTYGALLWSRYRDQDDLGYDSTRIAGELQQFFPIFDKKRVIAVRGAFNHQDPAAGSRVPFYYTTPLGGKDSVRGFSDFRFRDVNGMLFNAEYRWEAFSGLDMALFYDIGDVKPRWDELSFNDLKQSWGLGFRFNTYRAIFMRAEIAFNSGEGTKYYVAFSGPLRLERYIR